jgi:hypothetical protein
MQDMLQMHRNYRAGSIMVSNPSPMYVLATDVYALTHAVMFETDFGFRRIRRWVAPLRTSAFIDAVCVWQLANDNLDLSGELLMAAAYLHLPLSAHRMLAFHVLRTVWNDFGFLPSPSLQVHELHELLDTPKAAYAFLHTYHTTYVGALAFDAIYRDQNRASEVRARQPFTPCVPSTQSEVDSFEFAAARLRDLTKDKGTAMWTNRLPFDLATKDLIEVLEDTLLIEAARSYRLDVVEAELARLEASAPRLSPTARLAREFLSDQSGLPLPDDISTWRGAAEN